MVSLARWARLMASRIGYTVRSTVPGLSLAGMAQGTWFRAADQGDGRRRPAKDMESILDTQLKRLQTDRIDYYLMHSVTEPGRLAAAETTRRRGFPRAGQAGRARSAASGSPGTATRSSSRGIVDDYPWDFCQIQYNYLDEHHQAGREGLSYAAARGTRRGRHGAAAGRLPRREDCRRRCRPSGTRAAVKRTPAEWALRWVWDHPEVTVAPVGDERGEPHRGEVDRSAPLL